MRSASRLVIVALLGLFLALPAVPAAAALPAEVASPAVSAPVGGLGGFDRLVVQPTTPSSPGATAPSGPKLEPETEQDQAESRRKLIMGVTSVVLIGIVIWGRSIRRKRNAAG